jgi:hypothetical protein
MPETSIPFAEYIKAGAEVLALFKTLYPLLPTQSRDEVEAKIAAAEDALQKINVALAKEWNYSLHDCTFPPQIMLYDKTKNGRVCQNCGHTIKDFNRPLDYQTNTYF